MGSKVRFVSLTRSFDDGIQVFITTLVTIFLHCSPTLFSVQGGHTGAHRRTPAVGRAGSRADKDDRHFFLFFLRRLLFEVNFRVKSFNVDY